jgi:hypothetical protein
MNLGIARHLFALASVISVASCRPAKTETEKPWFPIIATDAGFEVPETVPAGICASFSKIMARKFMKVCW